MLSFSTSLNRGQHPLKSAQYSGNIHEIKQAFIQFLCLPLLAMVLLAALARALFKGKWSISLPPEEA